MPVMQAPAGGMVTNNLFTRGGRFLAKPLQRVSLVMRKLRERPVQLARFTQEELLAPAGEIHGETLTHDQLKAIEDHHNIPKTHRLSDKVAVRPDGTILAKKEDAQHFVAAARRSAAASMPELRHKTDAQAAAIAIDHLAHEAGHALLHPHGQDAKVWYATHVGTMEDAVGDDFGWKKSDPRHTLFKALVGITSAQRNPKENGVMAHKILSEAGGDFTKLPVIQKERHNQFLAAFHKHHGYYPQDVPDPYTDPQGAAKWYYHHIHPHPELKGEYYGRPAYAVKDRKNPGNPLNGIVSAIEKNQKMIPTPEGGEVWRKLQGRGRDMFEKIELPAPTPEGHIRGKSWSTQEGLGKNLTTLSRIVETLGGPEKARDWLLTKHPLEEIERVSGKKPDPGYLTGEPKIPGTFAFGPKFGPFILNLHSGSHPEHGGYLTPDMWWSQTYRRFLGTMTHSRKGQLKLRPEVPSGVKERKAMYEAAKAAASHVIGPDGKPLTVAELQATLWYHEQRFMRLLGVPSGSYSYSDAAEAIRKRGKS